MSNASFNVGLVLISSHTIQINISVVASQVIPETFKSVIHKKSLYFETTMFISRLDLVHATQHGVVISLSYRYN